MLPARLAAPGEPGQTSDFPQRGASRLPLPRATHAGLEIAAKTALNGAGRAPDGCSARTAPGLSAQIRAAARQKDVFGLGGVPRHLTRPLQSHTRRVWCRSSAACAAHFLGFLALLCHGGTEHPVAPCGHPGLGAAAAFPASPRQPHQKQGAEREGKSQLRLPKEQEKHREEPSLALLFPHATNKQSTK